MTAPIESGPVLVIDTSTRSSVVVVGVDEPMAVSRREVQHRHGSHLLEQIDEALDSAGLSLDDVVGVGVGTGPGSFTGLRVGLATAKTIAYTRSLPLVGVMSSAALRHAAIAAGADPGIAVVLPAGAHDHYLAATHGDPVLVPPGELSAALQDMPALSIDTGSDVLGLAADELGAKALESMPAAILTLARERLGSGSSDNVAELVPAYVALPRGVTRAAEELGWSPDLR